MVPRVDAPPLTSLGSVPFRVVIVFGFVCCYWDRIATHSTSVIAAILFSTTIEKPEAVLLPVWSKNVGSADAVFAAISGVNDTLYSSSGIAVPNITGTIESPVANAVALPLRTSIALKESNWFCRDVISLLMF